MEVVILTGMSGAGKTVAANYLEDMGYFCVDNAPLPVLKSMLNTFIKWEKQGGVHVNKVAFVVDVRNVSLASSEEQSNVFSEIEKLGVKYRIVFLEASDQEIINRYKQSRRNHPLAREMGILQALKMEREMMGRIKQMASDVIDTSIIEQSDLRDILYKMLSDDTTEAKMTILVHSFGFKYGIPVDSDNIVDVRFIPNPYYIPELKNLCGLDRKVKNYVLSFPETEIFMEKIRDAILFAIPYYVREGKVRLNIGIGCTGGRHRSVVLAEEMGRFLKKQGFQTSVFHRDLENDLLVAKKTKGKKYGSIRQK
jgi:RNase adapter protein RapZ